MIGADDAFHLHPTFSNAVNWPGAILRSVDRHRGPARKARIVEARPVHRLGRLLSQLYIRVRTGFYQHRKTAKLRVLIGDDAFWIPPRLWAYAAEEQPNGDVSGYSSEELAMLLGCSKHAPSIKKHLTDAGFLDGDGKIHDWAGHNGYHEAFAARAKTAANARWEKEKKEPKKRKSTDKEKDMESGDKHCLSNAQAMLGAFEALRLRICKWFKRRPNTPWDDKKEIPKLRKIVESKPDEGDLKLLDAFYASPDAPHRQGVETLLNNWALEIDRARHFASNGPLFANRNGKPHKQVEVSDWIKKLSRMTEDDLIVKVASMQITHEQYDAATEYRKSNSPQ